MAVSMAVWPWPRNSFEFLFNSKDYLYFAHGSVTVRRTVQSSVGIQLANKDSVSFPIRIIADLSSRIADPNRTENSVHPLLLSSFGSVPTENDTEHFQNTHHSYPGCGGMNPQSTLHTVVDGDQPQSSFNNLHNAKAKLINHRQIRF